VIFFSKLEFWVTYDTFRESFKIVICLRFGEEFKTELTSLLQNPTVAVKGTFTAAYQANQHIENGGEHEFSVSGTSRINFSILILINKLS